MDKSIKWKRLKVETSKVGPLRVKEDAEVTFSKLGFLLT